MATCVEVNLTYLRPAAPITHVYSIVGELVPWGWTPADAEIMTTVDNTVYTYVVDTFKAEAHAYQYKLTADKQWGVYELPASGNAEYAFSEAGDYKLEFSANIVEHTLALVATKLGGDTTVVERHYYIAGNMNGWAVADPDYEIQIGETVMENVPAGKWELKITDGQWGTGHEFNTLDTDCTSEGIYVADNGNIVVETAVKQNITIIFDGTLICIKAVTGTAPKKYYIAGDEGLTGKNWWVDYEDASLNEEGTKTFHNVPAGSHAFKITDGQWNNGTDTGHEFTVLNTECTSEGVTGGSGKNIEFTTYKVQDITISMDLQTFLICVTVDTSNPGGIEDTYVIAGDADLMGVAWDGSATQNKMTVTDGVATLVFDSINLTAKTYGFKVVKNGAIWIPDGMDNNSLLEIQEAAAYKVTFTYVIGEAAASAVAEKLGNNPPPVIDNDITVKVRKPAEWNTVYIWAWTDNGNVFSVDWPGVEMTADGNIYSYTFEKMASVNIIFNNGVASGTAQTVDINNVTQSTCFLIGEAGADGKFEASAVDCDQLSTGIEDIEAVLDPDAPIYNILGQQVNHLYRGIVIQNGHKFILK